MEIKKGQIYKRKDGDDRYGVLYAEITHIDANGCAYYYERNENWELVGTNNWHKELFLEDYELYTEQRYKVGDVLVNNFVNKSGDERKVLGVCGEVYLMSDPIDFDEYSGCYTKKELDRYDFKLKDAPQEDDIVELTLEEVAKLKGIDVSKLRIKD